MLGDHTPELAGIRCTNRFTLENDRRIAVQQGRINDVGMTDNPTDIRSGPIHIARIDVVDILHTPLQRHHMTAIVADDAFRLTGCTGRIENIEGVGCSHRDATGRRRRRHLRHPIVVVFIDQVAGLLLSLQNHTSVHFMRRDLLRFVEQRFVSDNPSGLDAA